MTILRRLVPCFFLLAAARGLRAAVTAPGQEGMECTAQRLATRGWVVDTAYTTHNRIRVVWTEGVDVDTVTAKLKPPPSRIYAEIHSDLWSGNAYGRWRVGSNVDHVVEVRRTLESCGIVAHGERPAPGR